MGEWRVDPKGGDKERCVCKLGLAMDLGGGGDDDGGGDPKEHNVNQAGGGFCRAKRTHRWFPQVTCIAQKSTNGGPVCVMVKWNVAVKGG